MTAMIPNALAFTVHPDDRTVSSLDFTYLKKNGRVAPFIPPVGGIDSKLRRCWALDGVRIDSRVYIYYVIVTLMPGGSPELFTVSGIGLARWDMPPQWKIGNDVSFENLGKLFNGDVPTFGDAVIQREKFLYCIGHKKTGPHSVSAFIARVSPADLTTRPAYSFLSGPG
jgi:hypothetical protein